MSAHQNIPNELRELNSSLPVPGHYPGQDVPAGYFEDLADQILQRAKAADADNVADELAALSPLLGSIAKKNPYTTPAGYFEDLSIQSNEEGLPEILKGLQQVPTYKVPTGYFEQLPEVVLRKAKAQQPAKVISIGRKVYRYAAAAIVTGIIAATSIMVLNKPADNDGTPTRKWVSDNATEVNSLLELAKVEPNVQVKTTTMEDLTKLVKDIPENDIQEFLNETQVNDASEDETVLN